ncbi:MAG: helix-turn-helix domain-containing protein [Clostridia bacterium]|nr:helix-turn-helix domain-containing protein [Clostridia bacterium]
MRNPAITIRNDSVTFNSACIGGLEGVVYVMAMAIKRFDVISTQKLSAYSAETKHNAVCDYLSGKGTLREIQKKYGIRSDKQLRNWIMKYNGHENLKASGTGGIGTMTKGRKTTYEERVEIVKYCIEHEMNYAQTSEKYQVSYQQIYQWTKKYQSDGVEGLVDRRGKRKTESEMSELEKLRAENRLLQAEKRKAELEIAFLKKLDEIERRRF